MIISDGWKDYTLLATGDGQKWERWGDTVLQRPDPQVIWPLDKAPRADAIYHRSNKGGGSWEYRHELPEKWPIAYVHGGLQLRFWIQPMGFKHTGLFPEQAANWEWLAERIGAAKAAGETVRVLNLFAYTGGATVAAAAAGADEVVHIDASRGMNQRARENLRLSGLGEAYVRILADDVLKFVEREQRRGRTYIGIIMDPPSYGRGPGGEVWQLEAMLWTLLSKVSVLLDPRSGHSFFLLNAYTTGLAPSILANLLRMLLPADGKTQAEEIGLPVADSGLVLPCGASGRWCRGL